MQWQKQLWEESLQLHLMIYFEFYLFSKHMTQVSSKLNVYISIHFALYTLLLLSINTDNWELMYIFKGFS